ncbi:hydrolase [Francisella adeliensis]|uniref:Hydrolase n=1 Tax=Francisella adeliensis TaxID=2007306 RepID=A0A2Z4XW29_9GAMM|nr:hydrolase [Francisella adeliensis]AXA32926.1 hydrolase [Francisella adeliensis]MBK2086424.1 hydrolase [Francisella adeliensis]MBK2096640.1 hydrolase [Francisella adeliensis]QIW11151.1 hydrolase [Francisella adeliensis]QIW13028.1 hydrolase [Francisella adeliensis]
MLEKLFSVSGGLHFDVAERDFGKQDKGISPNGAQDQLSFNIAFDIFDSPESFQAIEMIYPTKIVANKPMLFIICGAGYQQILIDENKPILKDKVYSLNEGQTISFGGQKSGFRTIIFAVESNATTSKYIAKKRSSLITSFITDLYSERKIRVVKGPEYYVFNDESLFDQSWKISQNSSQMGLVLEGDKLDVKKIEMISQPVTDGTVQLSPNGPIVLMRHRQTIGGYPRVLNVIETDMNKLAQLAMGESFRFKLIDFNEAIEINNKYRKLFSSIDFLEQ